MQFAFEHENPVSWFQPIVDTTDLRVFAHQCLYAGSPAQNSNPVLRGVSTQRRNGLTFIDVTGASPQAVLNGIKEDHWKIVCQMRLGSPAADGPFLRRVRTIYARESCGFAVETRSADLATMRLLDNLRPHYIKLDQSLVADVEHPRCANSVRHLVDAADQWGAVIIACGVREPETVENLWLLGVRNMQGDLFGLPDLSAVVGQKAQRRLAYPVCAQ